MNGYSPSIIPPRGLGLAEAGWHLRMATRVLCVGLCAAARRARTRRDLAALDGHLLRDIGITPGEAAREANKPFWRV